MLTIVDRDFNLHGCRHYAALMHRYFLPRRFREAVLEQDLAALYYAYLGAEMSASWLARIADGCTIIYRQQNMHKPMNKSTARACVRAVRAYEEDRYRRLGRKEIAAILDLNERLREEEVFILAEALASYDKLVAEGWHGKGRDFEIDLDIMFMLREDDPAYEDDDENLVFHLDFEPLKPMIKDKISGFNKSGVGDGCDYRTREDLELQEEEVYKVPHGYLFHQLMHTYCIPLPIIARIGEYFVQIKILKQWGLWGLSEDYQMANGEA